MAKKKKIIEEHKSEQVANSSQSEAAARPLVACKARKPSGDHKNVDIKSMIRIIRGQQVMFDFDLAFLYGVETRRLNEQVKRNIERFPEDFMFQLTKNELEILRSQIVTSNLSNIDGVDILMSQNATSKPAEIQPVNNWTSHFATSNYAKMGLRRPPYAFTRNGIGMLSSVLRSETAVGVNIRIMRAFTAIPQIVNQQTQVIQRIFSIEQHQQETDEKIELILDKIEEISPKQVTEQFFQTGCVWDAWSYVSDLVRSAKKRIELVDNFVDDRVLSLLIKRGKGVSATIHSRFTKDFLTDLEKHNTQYDEVKFVQLPHKNHDRFLIIDDDVYLLGASVKDMGNGLCAVTKLTVTPETVLGLLK